MVSDNFFKKYNELYELTETSLIAREEALVGLATAVALNCESCIEYYLGRCRAAQISEDEIGHVLEKVMVISAGQKKLTMNKVISNAPFV